MVQEAKEGSKEQTIDYYNLTLVSPDSQFLYHNDHKFTLGLTLLYV